MNDELLSISSNPKLSSIHESCNHVIFNIEKWKGINWRYSNSFDKDINENVIMKATFFEWSSISKTEKTLGLYRNEMFAFTP